MIRRIFFYLTTSLSIALVIVNCLSLFDDKGSSVLSILNFPKLHFFLFGILLMVLLSCQRRSEKSILRNILLLLLAITTVVHGLTLKNYTPLVEKSVLSYAEKGSPINTLTVMIANVEMGNSEFEPFLKLVRSEAPDILLVMETDKRWIENLSPISKNYAHKKEIALDNTYGMALYSKYKLENTAVKYLSRQNVPSIHTTIVFNKYRFNFHGVHPVPPVPSKHANNFGQKEKELLIVGKMVLNDSLPSLVAGDFNDVAWSNISTLFSTSGKLKDVRTGRGFYNTFSAKSVLVRWPLDHIYVTEGFEVVGLKRSKFFGSDHFAFIARLYVTAPLGGY